MKQTIKLWTLSAILAVICGVCVMTCYSSSGDAPSDSSRKEVRIAIAWRADADNEFCTNIVEAFREAGVTVTVLPQVKADYLDYCGNAVAATCLDSCGIGYLSDASGALLRSRGYDGSNAAEVMSGVDGVIFTGGEDIAPTLLATPQDWHRIEAEIDYNAARDVSDFLTMTYCLDHDIPLTGCPSWHHQALLSTEGTPLRVTATTTVSGIDMVEGIERTDKRCAVGVQFHPEAAIVKHTGKAVNSANADQFMAYDAAIPLFRAFIEVCKNGNNNDND